MLGMASASDYSRSNFFFQSGAAIIGIGSIMWIPPTLGNGYNTTDRWIFGNASYTGTLPDTSILIFDLKNQTVTCVSANCYKNTTNLKQGWHSIQLYLQNGGGANYSERRYIYVNVSPSSTSPLIIIPEEEAGTDWNLYLIIMFSALTLIGFFYYRSKSKENEEVEVEVIEDEST
jgi:hypothetical protein